MREFISKREEQASMILRRLISPSVRFRLRDAISWLREQLGRACLWKWELAKLPQEFASSPYEILYAGRKAQRASAKLLLTIESDGKALPAKSHISNQIAVVSEIPIPGALRVPCSLRVVVPLGRPIEEISAGFGDNLRRLVRRNMPRYRMQQALTDSEIDLANWKMLQPYASARHGDAATQIDPNEVSRLARHAGRLDFVILGDEVVACNLGCEFSMAGKRYWSTIRFGYPWAVFSDSKRLSETNAISFYLALEWALKNGFDYYDMGSCLARPEDELLQWKKRWGGELNMIGHHDHFHVRLPKVGAAQFFWNTPLFSAKERNLALHLGLPDGKSDVEFAAHYRKMNFGGLLKIYLHCTRPPSEHLLKKLRSLYGHRPPPVVEIVTPS